MVRQGGGGWKEGHRACKKKKRKKERKRKGVREYKYGKIISDSKRSKYGYHNTYLYISLVLTHRKCLISYHTCNEDIIC